MKVVFFGISTRKIAAIRYRVITFAEMLEREGHTCVVCLPSSVELFERLWTNGSKFTKGIWCLIVAVRRVAQLRHIFGADAIVFRGAVAPCGVGPPLFERFIRLFNKRMIYDIDDAVWNRQPYTTSFFYKMTYFNWIWDMCTMCATGFVGNQYLKEQCEAHGSSPTIVPTCIDMNLHTQKEYPADAPDRPVIIGRGDNADLRLEDPTISREHAVIRPEGDQWRLVDLGSKSGTRVNGVKVESATLDVDARLEIGRSTIVLMT
ncbi:MAG: FHA domain-containing protein, partial [bacterium]|nr:FHA domain-containing protein [bacterium]